MSGWCQPFIFCRYLSLKFPPNLKVGTEPKSFPVAFDNCFRQRDTIVLVEAQIFPHPYVVEAEPSKLFPQLGVSNIELRINSLQCENMLDG
jgi:hypothetical protein